MSADAPAMIAPPMGEWELVFGPREYEPDEGRDIQVGWAYGVERDGLQFVIHVEVAQSLAEADKTAVPDFVRAALRTRGARPSCRCSTARTRPGACSSRRRRSPRSTPSPRRLDRPARFASVVRMSTPEERVQDGMRLTLDAHVEGRLEALKQLRDGSSNAAAWRARSSRPTATRPTG